MVMEQIVSHRTCGAGTGGFVGSCLATKILKGHISNLKW